MQQLNQYVRVGHVNKTPLLIMLFGALGIVILAIYLANTSAQEHDPNMLSGEQESSFKLQSQANIVGYLEKMAKDNLNITTDQGHTKSDKYYLDMYDNQYNTQSSSYEAPALALNQPQSPENTDDSLFDLKSYVAPSPKEQLKANLAATRAQALLQALSSQTSVSNNQNNGASAMAAMQNNGAQGQGYQGNGHMGSGPQGHGQMGNGSGSSSQNSSFTNNYVNDAASKLAHLQKVNNSNLGFNGPSNNFSRIESHQTLNAYQDLVNHDTTMMGKVEPVLSPYLVRQGAVIPCTLLTGINSDLPGLVQAQVSQDVYDSPEGNYILIPKGSKVIGQYASAPMMGQERLMMAFNRVIFPDGKAMDLGAMVGSSLDGYSGFSAEVDNHLMRLLGNAVLLGGVTAGISLSVDDKRDDNGDLTLNGALTQSLGQSLGRVLTNVIERNLNTAPTLKVKPGFSFNVTLVKDIYFSQPYQASYR